MSTSSQNYENFINWRIKMANSMVSRAPNDDNEQQGFDLYVLNYP